MNTKVFEPFYPLVTEICLEVFDDGEPVDLLALMERLMAIEELPMHCPVHHYMVPAVLLTACRKLQGHGRDMFERDIQTALERAKNVLPGFCGYYGTCGAAVGIGIFWSIVTDSTPYSRETWGLMNRATGEALLEIAGRGGPRCCKRTSFVALQVAARQIREVLKLDLRPGLIRCHHHERNRECQGVSCPFYAAAAAEDAS